MKLHKKRVKIEGTPTYIYLTNKIAGLGDSYNNGNENIILIHSMQSDMEKLITLIHEAIHLTPGKNINTGGGMENHRVERLAKAIANVLVESEVISLYDNDSLDLR